MRVEIARSARENFSSFFDVVATSSTRSGSAQGVTESSPKALRKTRGRERGDGGEGGRKKKEENL